MTYTPIAPGTQNWDVPVNAAFTDQDNRITASAGNITDLQSANGGLQSASAYQLFGWTLDPTTVSTGQLLVNGTLYLARINVGTSGTATRLFWGSNTAGATPVSGQNFVSVFNSSGTRLANVNVDARVASTGQFTDMINVQLVPGFYWVGFLFNAATAPSVYRAQSLNGSIVNVNQPVSTARFATNGTGLTAMPTTINPASNTFGQFTLYAALGL